MLPRPRFPRWRSALFLFLVLFMVTSLAGVAPLLFAVRAAEVRIDVWPHAALAPADLRVQVRIERDSENRKIVVTADSADYFTSSEVQLDGEESPRVQVVVFRGLPAGSYDLRGVLIGQSGRVRGTARTGAIIAGR